MDIEFSPYDDPSYHMLEVKTGVRCVIVRAFNNVRTDYVQRDLQDIINKLELNGYKGVRLSDIETSIIPYKSGNEMINLVAIYSTNTYYQGSVIRYNNKPLIYSSSCIIVGDEFADLTMEQCYALVKSARAMTIDGVTSISVNVEDNMDFIPRILVADEYEEGT